MQDRIQDMLKYKSNDVWCIDRGATVSEAARRMRAHGVGTLIVVGDDKPGMVTEHEIVFAVLGCDKEPGEVLVSAIMTDVPVVGLGASIEAAAVLAAVSGAHQVVVVDDERIVGVIATKEMNAWLNIEQAFEISDLIGYITGCCAPPRHAVDPSLDRAPSSEATCAYCDSTLDEPNWELGVPLCGSCGPPEPVSWTPYQM